MADIPNGVNKLMFIKQTLISGYVSVSERLHKTSSPGIINVKCLTIMIRQ